MINEDDADLEDLEAMLYSQVYHISSEDTQTLTTAQNEQIQQSTQNLQKKQPKSRYYDMNNVNITPINTTYNNARIDSFIPLQNSLDPQFGVVHNSNSYVASTAQTQGNNDQQFVHMLNPINNFVVLPQIPTNVATPNQFNSARVSKNLEKFLQRETLRDEKRVKRLLRKKLNRRLKRKRQKESMSNKLNLQSCNESQNERIGKTSFKVHYLSQKLGSQYVHGGNHNEEDDDVKIIDISKEVINVSDSEEEICEHKKVEEFVIVSSDEESLDINSTSNKNCDGKNPVEIKQNQTRIDNNNTAITTNDDDVIFIAPKQVEVIEIDGDTSTVDLNLKSISEPVKDMCISDLKSGLGACADSSKQCFSDKSTETGSTNSTDTFIKIPNKPKRSPTSKQVQMIKERRELLSTPDSTTSNDFLDNSADIQQNKFNFGLHGSDFGSSHFLKPKSHTEIYESESSCSASDISTPIKNPPFNVVEFDSSNKPLFNEVNLETFGNYITPNRQKESESNAINCVGRRQTKGNVSKKLQKDYPGADIPSILTPNFDMIVTKVNRKALQDNCSDTSSESEYDDSKSTYLDKMKKKLPTLSTIESDREDNYILINKEQDKSDVSDKVKITAANIKDNRKRKSDQSEEKQKQYKAKKSRKADITINQENKSDINVTENSEKSINMIDDISTTDTNAAVSSLGKKDDSKPNKVCQEEIIAITDEPENTFDLADYIILDETGDEENIDLVSSSSFHLSDIEDVNDIELGNFDLGGNEFCKKDEHARKRTQFSDNWTADIDKFYNTSWGLENFSVKEAQKSMSDDPNHWKILDCDRAHIRLDIHRGPRCRKCREMGHIAAYCPNKSGPPSCSLCGSKGHMEPRCPNAMCTSCGRLGGYTTYCSVCAHWRNIQCRICKMYGHTDAKCPDLWRRYHLTTQPGPVVEPDSYHMKPRNDRWCSGCASVGHYEHNCRSYNKQHYSVTPRIMQYVDVYNFPKTPRSDLRQVLERRRGFDKMNVPMIKVTCTQTSEAVDKDKVSSVYQPSMCTATEKITENPKPLHNVSMFPPLNLIPLYFQRQLSSLESRINNSTEDSTFNRNEKSQSIQINNFKQTISNYTFNSKETPNFISLDTGKDKVETQTSNTDPNILIENEHLPETKLVVFRRKFAYLQSAKGNIFLDNIRRNNNVRVYVTNDDVGGTVSILGDENDVKATTCQLQEFLKTTPDINIIPRDSRLAGEFLRAQLYKLGKACGNCKDIFDRIMQRKLIPKSQNLNDVQMVKKNNRLIRRLYSTLHMLLFGRLKLKDGGKHLDALQYWENELKINNTHELPLKILFDIFESYSYIFNWKIWNEDYRGLVKSANYYIKPIIGKSPKMLPSERKNFETRMHIFINKCRKYRIHDQLQQIYRIQDDAIQSNYSRNVYYDFLNFALHFNNYMDDFYNRNTLSIKRI